MPLHCNVFIAWSVGEPKKPIYYRISAPLSFLFHVPNVPQNLNELSLGKMLSLRSSSLRGMITCKEVLG